MRISEYDTLVAPSNSDFLPIVHDGVTKKIPLGTVRTGTAPGVAAAFGAINAADYGSDGTAIANALQAAGATGARRLYIPSGTWQFSQSQINAAGKLLDLTNFDYLEVFGDGIGKTILTLPDPFTVNSAGTSFFFLPGYHQRIHDLSFRGANSVIGSTSNLTGIAVWGRHCRVHDCEFYRFNSNTQAGAACVSTYGNYAPATVNTTLGTTIAAGSQTVTPASMIGIYKGLVLSIGGTSENVTVTAVTATTFTATFANAHSASDSVTAQSHWFNYGTFERLYVHDCFTCTAFVNNGLGNTWRNSRVLRCGNTAGYQHGIYNQGGHSLFHDIYFEGIGGYSIHQYPNFGGVEDSSGNVYDRIVSINPGTMHAIITQEGRQDIDGDVSNGSDSILPAGLGLSRYTRITNCLFKNTFNEPYWSSLDLPGPVYFDGNVLEDVARIDSRSAYSQFTPNNISRRIFATGPIAVIPVTTANGAKMCNAPADKTFFTGQDAFAEAPSGANSVGGDLELAPGWGVKKFTVLSNTAGAVTLTVDVVPTNFSFPAVMVSGTDFNLGTDNTAGQLHQTALNIAQALYNKNVYQYAMITVNGPNVFLRRNPQGFVADLTIVSNQPTRISTTSDANGKLYVRADLESPRAGYGIILKSPDGTKRARLTIDNTGALITTII